MKCFLICLAVCFSFGLNAQKIYDKEATALLSKISDKIKSHEQILASFTVDTDFPGSDVDTQMGSLTQNKGNYFVAIGENELLNTEEGFYLIDKTSKSVQINDPLKDSTTDIYNPISIMEKYDSGEFEYAIVGEDKIDSKRCYLIEFKPTDRYAELSKIRLAIDVATELPLYIKVFNKDASRITINVDSMELIKESDEVVKFKRSNYLDYTIEDLRID